MEIERNRKMKCRIRKWELSDARDLAAALSNKKVQDNLRDGLPYPYTEQDGKDFISAMLSADENETFAFAITVDNIVIGSIGIFRQSNIHRQTAELGYYIAEEYWGRGITTEAVTQICKYVFSESDIIRISAEPFAQNRASCRVLEKAEGTEKPPKSIIERPELQIYITDFGKADDWCLVAEVKEKIVGAVWVRIMNDYGHIDDKTPSLAISLYEEYRNLGLGTALMKTMLQVLKNKGYKQTSLSVQKANYAVNMYRKP